MNFQFDTKPYVVRDTHFNKPTWDEVIDLVDFSFNNNQPHKDSGNYGLVVHCAEMIPSVEYVVNEIQKHHEHCTDIDSHVYMSLSSMSKTFGRHRDDVDVFFWQVKGQTRWIVEGSQKVSTTLNSGDIIYVPRGLYHDTRPLGPRFGISFGVYYE